MEQLSIALRSLFSRQSGDDILSAAGYLPCRNSHAYHNESDDGITHLDCEMTESDIISLLYKEEDRNYSLDQLAMTGQMIISKWMARDKNCLPLQFSQSDTVFNLLLHFGSKVLCLCDGDPVCRYEYLLRWHTLTSQMGEDIFTTSWLAARNLKMGASRTCFDWDAFINHDYRELNSLFERHMADLHLHLKGSSYNCEISWLCLMNNIERMEYLFDNMSDVRKDFDKQLFYKVKRAAVIRYYLAGIVGLVSETISKSQLYDFMDDFMDDDDERKKNHKTFEGETRIHIPDYQCQSLIDKAHIESLKKDYCHSDAYDQHIPYDLIIDYIAVDHYPGELVENLTHSSERMLMYKLFTYIYGNYSDDKDLASLFYAYLAYKDEFRHTILQLNHRVGFKNFANYENLKSQFILPKYETLMYKAAIEGFLQKHRGKRYMEVRITPKNTDEELRESLSEIIKAIKPCYHDQWSVVLHFIKKRDESYKAGCMIRHNALRAEIKQQAFAIYNFRKNATTKDNLVGKVVGIDAANSEIYTRPEVFAQAFRFLRTHESFRGDLERPDDLHVTYHVGEDFLDIADGLRAVDEALIFLGLRSGDRLGHALVLGTDIREYYRKRSNTICESKQVLLDNMAWLHHQCIRLVGYTPLCGFLEKMFHRYFRDIYCPSSSELTPIEELFSSEPNELDAGLDNIETYYLSWLLRGNSPRWGSELDKEYVSSLTDDIEKQWVSVAVNHRPDVEMACRNENARELYDMYHSGKLTSEDNDVDSFTIPFDYREEYYSLLEKIQEYLLQKIENKHIAIECNPSSNFKIGEMERYDNHPILRFFNYGLDVPYPDHNISVSINTDDKGVFSTSLEREFSLLALAMEKNDIDGHNNSPRAIIEWLNKVREMAIEQKFDHSH